MTSRVPSLVGNPGMLPEFRIRHPRWCCGISMLCM